ncbi:MAG: RNA polymerase sigma factor [Pseudonocardiaceae bacterium]
MATTELTTRTTTCVDHETDLTDLVAKARAGCLASWREIVDRFDDRLQRVARAKGADGPTAADVVQQTWLAAIMNIDALRNAGALGGWLHSILHREYLKVLSHRHRETLRADETNLSEHVSNSWSVMVPTQPRSPEDETLRSEQRMLVRTAIHRMSRRDRDLLALLVTEPPMPYTEISRRLGMPMGSIGPTRARCLARLRGELAALGVRSSAPGG